MSKFKNLAYLLLFGGALLCLKFLLIDHVFVDLPKDAGIWFTSGLLLVILGIFVTEKYFTKSLDVLVNVITLTIVLLTLDRPGNFHLWGALLTYSGCVGILALTSFTLFNEEKDQNLWSQRIADMSGTVARFLGSARIMFSIVFILSIFNYFVFSLENNLEIGQQQIAILLLIIFWGAVLLIEPIDKKLIQPLIDRMRSKVRPHIVGKVVRRISPNIVVAEQTPNTPPLTVGSLSLLDDVKQTHSGSQCHPLMYLYSQDADSKRLSFFYSLNQNLEEVAEQIYIHSLGVAQQYEIAATYAEHELLKNKTNLIGFVYAGSDIDVIKVKMIDGIDEKKQLKEGDLLSVNFYKCPTKYQIINVETSSESVEGANKQGGKMITAQQIGSWKQDRHRFEDTGWVPEMNAPVFIENTAGEQIAPLDGNNNYLVGVIPKSKYPVYINFEETISHHLAIIGKTGTGKSRMAAKIVAGLARAGYKIVVLEVDRTHPQSLSKRIDFSLISSEDTTWTSSQVQRTHNGRQQHETVWDCQINLDAVDGRNVFVVNLDNQTADMDGGPLSHSESACAVVKRVLQYKNRPENEDKKICIVMEEAYDFVPESTFGQQDFGQPNVSRIAQLLLKCRKHNVGFLIITQRTALVSKTILYQCNTIIALQTFDETSKNFMGAYINQKYLESMSILPRFRAIVVGKGSSCDKPVIVDFKDENAVTATTATTTEVAVLPAEEITGGTQPEV